MNILEQNLSQITSIGLCDVETETLQQIHDGAGKVKPSSITVKLESILTIKWKSSFSYPYP